MVGLSEEEVRSRGGDEEEEMRLREGEMVADSFRRNRNKRTYRGGRQGLREQYENCHTTCFQNKRRKRKKINFIVTVFYIEMRCIFSEK